MTHFLKVKDNLSGVRVIRVSHMILYGPGGRGSISGRLIPKTQKMVLDAALFNTQYY